MCKNTWNDQLKSYNLNGYSFLLIIFYTMHNKRKTKPLFAPIKMDPSEFLQERKKKISKLQIQDAVDKLEQWVRNAEYSWDAVKEVDKFKRKLRKALKYL